MARSDERIVRQAIELINTSESVDEAMEGLAPVMDPEIEWSIRRTQSNAARATVRPACGRVLESFAADAGVSLTVEVQEVEEKEIASSPFRVCTFEAHRAGPKHWAGR